MKVSAVIFGALALVVGRLSNANGNSLPQTHFGPFRLTPLSEDNAVSITVEGINGNILATGKLGLSLPSAVGMAETCSSEPGFQCFQWGDFAKVELRQGSHDNCYRVQWTSTEARQIEDCYELQQGVHWYGGGETHTQTWPIENNPRQNSPYVTGDFLQSNEFYYGGVVENYWLLSTGAAIKVDDDAPLYFALNTTRRGQACFTAKDGSPYTARSELKFGYEWCIGNNLKDAHQTAMSTFYEKPVGIPDERMLIQPLWSTWAEYKVDVNQETVLQFARKVVDEGFVNSSHIEIDDNWETCYGEQVFHPEKFPDPKAMIDEIKGMNNMRVTAWIHPFINLGCPSFNHALENNYFVQNTKPRTGLTWWWQGSSNAGLIDMTNSEATAWWTERLRSLQQETGLTSYKFDAGETSWLPAATNLNNNTNSDLWPNLFTTSYVDTVAQFGGLIETRVARKNQKQPVFIRMLDKDSRWGYDNGLQSMIPTLLHFSTVGYAFVLPDMIGGNAYNGEMPSQELYVRWMQVNIFMPAVQFSLVPWNIGATASEKAETVRICLKVLEDRKKYADHILRAARQATEDGSPVNRPLWWVDPNDSETYAVDDQYMLGDSLLVAPVVKQGATSRDIYLPTGTWTSATDSQVYNGPTKLTNFPVPLDVVPFFIKSA